MTSWARQEKIFPFVRNHKKNGTKSDLVNSWRSITHVPVTVPLSLTRRTCITAYIFGKIEGRSVFLLSPLTMSYYYKKGRSRNRCCVEKEPPSHITRNRSKTTGRQSRGRIFRASRYFSRTVATTSEMESFRLSTRIKRLPPPSTFSKSHSIHRPVGFPHFQTWYYHFQNEQSHRKYIIGIIFLIFVF